MVSPEKWSIRNEWSEDNTGSTYVYMLKQMVDIW